MPSGTLIRLKWDGKLLVCFEKDSTLFLNKSKYFSNVVPFYFCNMCLAFGVIEDGILAIYCIMIISIGTTRVISLVIHT